MHVVCCSQCSGQNIFKQISSCNSQGCADAQSMIFEIDNICGWAEENLGHGSALKKLHGLSATLLADRASHGLSWSWTRGYTVLA